MNMIEIDPKLFIKCRLCLDETGQYQIVPKVQMQIKYCFDIDVEPFDGLPQLVCKKCESILSQYAGIKQIFQEKQSKLKSNLGPDVHSDNDKQQQDTVTSTQTEVENKISHSEVKKHGRKESLFSSRSPSREKDPHNGSDQSTKIKITLKKPKKLWQDVSYEMCFVCRYCTNAFKSKKGVLKHVYQYCNIYIKYSCLLNSCCVVGLRNIGSKPNLTGSKDYVVCNKNKIINSTNAHYIVLYSLKTNKRHISDSSEDDTIIDNKKRKRRRLVSRSSNETAIIERNTVKGIPSDDEELDGKSEDGDKKTNLSDIECVNIDDSDSASTKSSLKAKDVDHEPLQNCNIINDKMINNIITMCSSKYINRYNGSRGVKNCKEKEESSLKHKILSIGRKVINNKGINCTGLLRYLEHKDLEVIWLPTLDSLHSNVVIRTRQKESTDIENSNFGWENITSFEKHKHKTQDFIDVFEKVIENDVNFKTRDAHIDANNKSERKILTDEKTRANDILFSKNSQTSVIKVNENIRNNNPQPSCSTSSTKINLQSDSCETDKLSLKKLLNANPVANPKQLPKKTNIFEIPSVMKNTTAVADTETQSNNEEFLHVENSNELHMPIITSTVSLAGNEQENVKAKSQTTKEINLALNKTSVFPKIKVKPAAELMSEHALNQQNSTQDNFVSTNNWTVHNQNNVVGSNSTTVMVQSNNSNIVYMTNMPVYNPVVPAPPNVYPQYDAATSGVSQFYPNVNTAPVIQSQSHLAFAQREYVKLHTVELPNTRTDSPYQYFQKLLQIHNIHLLSSTSIVSAAMSCLMKFKVVFEQETNAPVRLSLFLFCYKNVFCIKAKDDLKKDLDIDKFSPNWQWEILKVFKGDVVPQLNNNAKKLGNDVFNTTVYFISLLKSIVFSKVT